MSSRIRGVVGSVVVLAWLLSCGGSEKPPTKGNGGSTGDGQEASLRQQMHDHFVNLSKAKASVIEGDLQAAKASASGVWPKSSSELPSEWRPYVMTIQGSLELMKGATELETAAQAVSAIGRACGDCHQALGLQAVEAGSIKPPPADTLGDYMRLHQWAADRMWEGLIGPSDEAWTAGGNALKTPIDPSKIPEAVLVKPGMDELLRRVQELSGAVAEPGTPAPVRQRIYGEFLGTCARCHRSFLEGVD